MALQQKLDEGDIALLEVVEDAVFLGEFLRSTNDGEIDKKLWPQIPWKYRDYQRQFLTDKEEFILFTGGRSIGKCSPSSARVYTTQGYRTLGKLAQEKAFVVYTLTPEMTLEQRRAVCVPDKRDKAYSIITEAGHEFVGTANHPILTPAGYKLMNDISVDDYVAIATYLPHESIQQAFQWHELRLFGYISLIRGFTVEQGIKPRFTAIGKEFEYIADQMLVNWHKSIETGKYTFIRKISGKFPHPITSLLRQLRQYENLARYYIIKRIPDMIKAERLENIQVMLESMFAQHAILTQDSIVLNVTTHMFAQDIQELLLRFGIESSIHNKQVTLLDSQAVYKFYTLFNLPGIGIGQLKSPAEISQPTPFMRFDRVVNKYQSRVDVQTFAVHVYQYNNYISDNIFVHNSVVLQDKIIHEIVNSDIEFPHDTKASVLVTPNLAQMTPIRGELSIRFNAGKFLKGYLQNVNMQEGVMKFATRKDSKPFIFNFRIAGSKGENNMVGLHIPRIRADETQLFPLPAWTQLQPTLNTWQPKKQIVAAGVPNGLRNSVLYILDQQTPRYKKYRIPSHNNPFYTYEEDVGNIRTYGGEQDDRYQQLVLGRHGAAAFQVIPRETITTETFAFSRQVYNSGHVNKGIPYDELLQRPDIPEELEAIVLAIDTGFVDPTIIEVIGRDKKGIWRTYIRYKLVRIDFNTQQKIIDWIASYYHVGMIAIDIGAGGGGAGMMHNLIHDEQYKKRKYEQRMIGIQFSEQIIAGYDDDGEELKQDAKGFAANELAKMVQQGRLVFSEFDHEALSQLERVAKQKIMSGKDRYFVLNDKGAGPDDDDHIFASYICFILGIKDAVINPTAKKLGTPRGAMT